MPQNTRLTTKDATILLDLLCNNDDFRAAFSSDPGLALLDYSLLPSASPQACALSGELASKEEFIRLRSELHDALAGVQVFQVPHYFETGMIEHAIADARRPKVA